eukprot:41030-Eustigmatos_ZCMA.PRE.1
MRSPSACTLSEGRVASSFTDLCCLCWRDQATYVHLQWADIKQLTYVASVTLRHRSCVTRCLDCERS